MDDFHVVAIEQYAVCMQTLGHDLTIDFDRDLAIGELRGKQQIADAAAFFDIARLAVEQNLVHALV